ncbi:hypothetical protein TNIN_340781 [Trichonephila inaurata madagascariensis]|uniref:Uncharacterized protein n=1 Tax=Trichonephila inaurata madagascariensis TaxID=2747483 RepID=A0A8X6XYF5_9ARAC|nr:hypothetical protein TNIN_340781 [Trichonephila inaurata madagascariensis]
MQSKCFPTFCISSVFFCILRQWFWSLSCSSLAGKVHYPQELKDNMMAGKPPKPNKPDHIRPAKTIRPATGKPFKSTTSLPRTTTSEQKVKGLNIGLHYILENIKRKLKYRNSVPNELLIKVFVLSSKIEQSGGEVFPVNKNGMKIISDLLPSSYKNAICSA